jgi:hypothetical protein
MASTHNLSIARARQQIATAEIKIALDNITSTEKQELWELVDGLETSIKRQAASPDDELELIDRELENRFRRPSVRLR